ncbi:MAG: TIGR02594 family protein [Bacteroidota bacterium]
MTINDREYTKHYYIEGQRVCSKIGGGMLNNPIGLQYELALISSNFTDKRAEQETAIRKDAVCVGFNKDYLNLPPAFQYLQGLISSDNLERDQFFYHSDHLGSSSFITDASGITTQHLQYLPFGETFVEQSSNAPYNTPYKFSGKEKDEETGYSYFGARYLNTDFSIWLSVDPMSDDYPHQSPFMYCSGNPINKVDPDGMNDGWVEDNGDKTHNVYWDPKVSSKAEAVGKTYHGETTLAMGKNENAMYGDNKGNWHDMVTLAEFKVSADKMKSNSNTATPWMDKAKGEIGVKEYNPGSNLRIETYLKSAGLNNATDATAWCAAFVHWSLAQAGIKGAGATGNNYKSWGIPLYKPAYGAVALFKTGHVGFYMGTNKDGTLKILHGNWSNRVKISSGVYDPIYPISIRQYRMPR